MEKRSEDYLPKIKQLVSGGARIQNQPGSGVYAFKNSALEISLSSA